MHFKQTLLIFITLVLAIAIVACDSPPGVQPIPESPNLLRNMQVNPATVNFVAEQGAVDTTIVVSIIIDTNPTDELREVTYNLSRPGESSPIQSGILTEDVPGQRFSGTISINTRTNDFETFSLSVTGTMQNGNQTNTLSSKIRFIGFLTDPPVVEWINHPETITIPSQGELSFRIETRAFHPNGQNNLEQVLLEIFDSGGNQIGGQPFEMRDDGDTSNSGDLVAADSIFTVAFTINENNSPESFSIFTYARDHQGLVSDTLFSNFSFVQ